MWEEKMKQQYKESRTAYTSQASETRKLPIGLEKTSEILICWGRGANRVYLSASQAIDFIKISRDSEIN